MSLSLEEMGILGHVHCHLLSDDFMCIAMSTAKTLNPIDI
jgi:hypothetical protein